MWMRVWSVWRSPSPAVGTSSLWAEVLGMARRFAGVECQVAKMTIRLASRPLIGCFVCGGPALPSQSPCDPSTEAGLGVSEPTARLSFAFLSLLLWRCLHTWLNCLGFSLVFCSFISPPEEGFSLGWCTYAQVLWAWASGRAAFGVHKCR